MKTTDEIIKYIDSQFAELRAKINATDKTTSPQLYAYLEGRLWQLIYIRDYVLTGAGWSEKYE